MEIPPSIAVDSLPQALTRMDRPQSAWDAVATGRKMSMEDLPQEHQQHVDDQTALSNPPGPGRAKTENLRRIERQVAEQRRRRRETTEAEEQEETGPEVPGL
jgi:hypothetical protein